VKNDRDGGAPTLPADYPAAPLTLEGFAILHQMFRVRRAQWRTLDGAARERMTADASRAFDAMGRREAGETALYSALGHKSDLMVVHFRRGLDDLSDAQREVASLALTDYFEPVTSYLSVIEIGLYEATVALYERLAEKSVRAHSPEFQRAVEDELETQRLKLGARLFPKIPGRRYLCFYPMDKKRDSADNWYRLPIAERRRLMHEHGLVGRRYAGQVTQIISGSVGLDNWEWGVDLFADDPLVFKKLVYEMRFDEASAAYAKFGAFHVGIRLAPPELGKFLAV
jgi:peroxiredoxin